MFDNHEQGTLIQNENILYLLMFTFVNSIIGIMTLINLVQKKNLFADKIQEWQVIAGLIISGFAVVVYIILFALVFLLYRSLRETILVNTDEADSLFLSHDRYGSNTRSYTYGGNAPQIGSYDVESQPADSGSSMFRDSSTTSTKVERFPGKGVKLGQ